MKKSLCLASLCLLSLSVWATGLPARVFFIKNMLSQPIRLQAVLNDRFAPQNADGRRGAVLDLVLSPGQIERIPLSYSAMSEAQKTGEIFFESGRISIAAFLSVFDEFLITIPSGGRQLTKADMKQEFLSYPKLANGITWNFMLNVYDGDSSLPANPAENRDGIVTEITEWRHSLTASYSCITFNNIGAGYNFTYAAISEFGTLAHVIGLHYQYQFVSKTHFIRPSYGFYAEPLPWLLGLSVPYNIDKNCLGLAPQIGLTFAGWFSLSYRYNAFFRQARDFHEFLIEISIPVYKTAKSKP